MWLSAVPSTLQDSDQGRGKRGFQCWCHYTWSWSWTFGYPQLPPADVSGIVMFFLRRCDIRHDVSCMSEISLQWESLVCPGGSTIGSTVLSVGYIFNCDRIAALCWQSPTSSKHFMLSMYWTFLVVLLCVASSIVVTSKCYVAGFNSVDCDPNDGLQARTAACGSAAAAEATYWMRNRSVLTCRPITT